MSHFVYTDYEEQKLKDLQNVSLIFSSAVASLSAAPHHLTIPSFAEVSKCQHAYNSTFQYTHDKLTYRGELEFGAVWCGSYTCWVVNLRLVNNGFLNPDSNELKKPSWTLVDDQSEGHFSVLTKYVTQWMGKPIEVRVVYNPSMQRLDIYFRPRNKSNLDLPFSFNVHFEPGAPIDTFDDDLWQDVE